MNSEQSKNQKVFSLLRRLQSIRNSPLKALASWIRCSTASRRRRESSHWRSRMDLQEIFRSLSEGRSSSESDDTREWRPFIIEKSSSSLVFAFLQGFAHHSQLQSNEREYLDTGQSLGKQTAKPGVPQQGYICKVDHQLFQNYVI